VRQRLEQRRAVSLQLHWNIPREARDSRARRVAADSNRGAF
jgi:hypothetical protein